MAKKQQAVEIINYTVASVDRQVTSVSQWRDALRAAESPTTPRRKRLYDLHAELLLDPHVSAAVEKRMLNVLSSDIKFFNKDGKENEQVCNLLRLPFFRRMCRDILMSVAHGHSLLYFEALTDTECKYHLIDRRNVRPESGVVVKNVSDDAGVSYRDTPTWSYVVEAGEPKDLGLLTRVAPYVIYKKNTLQDWATLNEVCGFPFKKVTYSGNDPAVRKELEDMMRKAWRAAWAVIPELANLEIVESKVNSSISDMFQNLGKVCDDQVSKAFLGNTMTMDAQGGNYKGEIHEKSELRIADSDRVMLLSVLGSDFAKVLQAFGFKVEGGWFAFERERMSLKEMFDFDERFHAVAPLPEEYWYDTYGKPRPSEAEVKKKKEPAPQKEKEGEEAQLSEYLPFVPPAQRKKIIRLAWDFFAQALRRKG